MRVTKSADDRKNEILDVANDLFTSKGFDETSISDIQSQVGIARGTLYYHFKSKEEILDSLINRYTEIITSKAQEVSENKKIPVMERLEITLKSLNITLIGGEPLINELHAPQNSLMHEKSRVAILKSITPIIANIIEEGEKEEVFSTPFPYETVELLMTYVLSVFDSSSMKLTKKESTKRIESFILNAEKVLGTKEGELSWLKELLSV